MPMIVKQLLSVYLGTFSFLFEVTLISLISRFLPHLGYITSTSSQVPRFAFSAWLPSLLPTIRSFIYSSSSTLLFARLQPPSPYCQSTRRNRHQPT